MTRITIIKPLILSEWWTMEKHRVSRIRIRRPGHALNGERLAKGSVRGHSPEMKSQPSLCPVVSVCQWSPVS